MKSTEKIESKVIYVDEMGFNRQRDSFLDNLEVLNKIASLYDELEIGHITDERAKQIINLEGEYTEIRANVQEYIKKKALYVYELTSMQREAEKKLDEFEKETGKLRRKFNYVQTRTMGIPTPLEYFTLKEGRFEITDETWQRIKDERCSNILHTESEKKVHDALLKLATATNEFVAAIGPIAKGKIFPLRQPSDFLIYRDEGFTPDPETNYKMLAQ